MNRTTAHGLLKVIHTPTSITFMYSSNVYLTQLDCKIYIYPTVFGGCGGKIVFRAGSRI